MTAERRLDAVANELTAKERALLVLRADFAGLQLDERMRRVLRPQEPDCQRIVMAVHDAGNEVYHACAFLAEWLYQEDIQLGWLECLDAMLERDARLCEVLEVAGWTLGEGDEPSLSKKARQVTLRPLPAPGRGLTRTLPLIWGERAYPDEDDTPPPDWPSLREQLAFELRRTVGLRWRDHLAYLAVLDEVGELFGEPVIDPEVAGLLDKIGKKLLELYEGLCRRGERFPLPQRDEQRIEAFRRLVRWGDLREAQAVSPPVWIPPHMHKELDELEARLAEELRAGREAAS